MHGLRKFGSPKRFRGPAAQHGRATTEQAYGAEAAAGCWRQLHRRNSAVAGNCCLPSCLKQLQGQPMRWRRCCLEQVLHGMVGPRNQQSMWSSSDCDGLCWPFTALKQICCARQSRGIRARHLHARCTRPVCFLVDYVLLLKACRPYLVRQLAWKGNRLRLRKALGILA
jgi:hypothetical protein